MYRQSVFFPMGIAVSLILVQLGGQRQGTARTEQLGGTPKKGMQVAHHLNPDDNRDNQGHDLVTSYYRLEGVLRGCREDSRALHRGATMGVRRDDLQVLAERVANCLEKIQTDIDEFERAIPEEDRKEQPEVQQHLDSLRESASAARDASRQIGKLLQSNEYKAKEIAWLAAEVFLLLDSALVSAENLRSILIVSIDEQSEPKKGKIK